MREQTLSLNEKPVSEPDDCLEGDETSDLELEVGLDAGELFFPFPFCSRKWPGISFAHTQNG